MAATDRLEQIDQISTLNLKGSPLGSKVTMKRVEWQPDDGGLTTLPYRAVIRGDDDDDEMVVDTFADLLIAYAFWPERRPEYVERAK